MSLNPHYKVSGTLVIVVDKARDLPNIRKLDKQSPYCLLRINGLPVQRSKTIYRGGQTPEWDHELRFNITPDIEPKLGLMIFDGTKESSSLIASTEIDLTKVFIKGDLDDWYHVHSESYKKNRGEIYLQMTFYPDAPIVPPKIVNTPRTSKRASDRPLPAIPGSKQSFDLSPLDNELTSSVRSNSVHKPLPLPPLEDQLLTPPPYSASPSLSVFSEPGSKERDREQERERGSVLSKISKRLSKSVSPSRELLVSSSKPSSDTFDVLEQQIQSEISRDPSDIGKKKYIASSWVSKSRPPKKMPVDEQENIAPRPKSMDHSQSPFSSSRSPKGRKPPPPVQTSFSDIYLGTSKVSIPAYEVSKQDEILDPKHFAPTPDINLSKALKFQDGKNLDLKDFRFSTYASEKDQIDRGGYVGDGKWNKPAMTYSQIRKQQLREYGLEENQPKPLVPPKVPIGMNTEEYYYVDREKFLRDIHGDRS
ncbi:BA75_01282T0 [Komagataella pastoris]|uniref:BA75_01282T0 n=1 Tax=Komagataella pastoris TaxID=4922 RepID=A0A1B2J6K5_PICPA|nr:BA75_01282T0 [Komagataella pastoris]